MRQVTDTATEQLIAARDDYRSLAFHGGAAEVHVRRANGAAIAFAISGFELEALCGIYLGRRVAVTNQVD